MSKKILSVLLTAVLLVATFCVVVPSASALTGTIYFQVPADWATDYTEVYCHYWGEDGIVSPDWQSAQEVCTEVADGIYGYVLPEGNVTGLVFSVNNADKNQTADITNLDGAEGKIATIDGDACTWVEPATELGEVKANEPAASEEPVETTGAEEISGTIYFEIPESWKNFETVYCHVWDAAGTSIAGWQTDEEVCTKVEDNLYSYEIPAGAWTFAIFSNDNGLQTGDTPLTANEIGKVMYYTGNKVENPMTGEDVDEAAWKDLETASEPFGGTIYFEIPDSWKNFETVYCHVWGKDGDLAGWQTDGEVCTKVNDKLYSFTIPEGNWTNAIFSNDIGTQTGDTPLTANEMGKVMYYTGNKVENPMTGDDVDEAAWKDYEEPTTSDAEPASSAAEEPEPEKSNNIALYIIICAAVVILIIVIVVVAKKKKK